MGLAPPTEILGIKNAESEEEVSFHPILLLFEYHCEDALLKWVVLGLLLTWGFLPEHFSTGRTVFPVLTTYSTGPWMSSSVCALFDF